MDVVGQQRPSGGRGGRWGGWGGWGWGNNPWGFGGGCGGYGPPWGFSGGPWGGPGGCHQRSGMHHHKKHDSDDAAPSTKPPLVDTDMEEEEVTEECPCDPCDDKGFKQTCCKEIMDEVCRIEGETAACKREVKVSYISGKVHN